MSSRFFASISREEIVENISISRVFLLYTALLSGFLLERLKPPYKLTIFTVLVFAESNFLHSDLVNAWVVTVVLAVLLIVRAWPRSRTAGAMTSGSTRTAVVAVTIVTCARLLRRHAWVCRTFRGEDEIASLITPALFGFVISMACTYPVRASTMQKLVLKITVPATAVAAVSVMSPWHGYGHAPFIAISFIGVAVICFIHSGWRSIALSVVGAIVGLSFEQIRIALNSGGANTARVDHVILFAFIITHACVAIQHRVLDGVTEYSHV